MDPANLQAHNQQKMRQAPAAPRRYDGANGNPLYDPSNGGHYGMFTLLPPAPRRSLQPSCVCYSTCELTIDL